MPTVVVAPRPGKSRVFSHPEGEVACGGKGGDEEPDHGGSGDQGGTLDGGGSPISPLFPPGNGLGHAGADSELRGAADPGW